MTPRGFLREIFELCDHTSKKCDHIIRKLGAILIRGPDFKAMRPPATFALTGGGALGAQPRLICCRAGASLSSKRERREGSRADMYFRDAGSKRATWAVVATCRESLVLTECFVTHHLAQGAAYVELFLDAPDPVQENALARIPGCRVTVCDDSYWQETLGGPRPPTNEKRQLRNAGLAYARAEADWLVHLDADEFIETDMPLTEVLSALPDKVDFLHLPNVERVFDATRPQEELFDGYMRVPLVRGWLAQEVVLAPDVQPFLHRGVVAHSQGKSVVRTGRGCWMGIHSPRAGAGRERLLLWPATRARVLHYDGLTGFHWIMKLLRGWSDRGGGVEQHGGLAPARQAQIGYVDENRGDMHALLQLHQKLKALLPEDLERLEAMGLLRRPAIDPGAALRHMGRASELSRSAFDDRLDFELRDFERHRIRWRRLYRLHFAPADGDGSESAASGMIRTAMLS